MAKIVKHNPNDPTPDACKLPIDRLLYYLQKSLSPEEEIASKDHCITLANMGEEIASQYADGPTGSRIATAAILSAAYGFCLKIKLWEINNDHN